MKEFVVGDSSAKITFRCSDKREGEKVVFFSSHARALVASFAVPREEENAQKWLNFSWCFARFLSKDTPTTRD